MTPKGFIVNPNPLEYVKNLIENSLPDAHVEVTDLTGTLDHLNIFVVSDQFNDLPLLQQHKIVMDILKNDLKDSLHAVKITTKTFKNYPQLRK
jgi:stress-induced morphogen